MGRPGTVYRGKRRYRWVITLILFILVLVLGAVLLLFNYMQKFIVYDKDGLSLVLPFMAGEEESPDTQDDVVITAPGVVAEIVIEEPSFDELDFVAGQELEDVKARYVAAESMSASGLAYYGSELGGKGQNAMLLQLKTADGMLSYLSGVALTNSYGVNGQQNISDAVTALKEQGVYMIAEINTLLDSNMALRNAPIALKNSSGAVLSNSRGSWLDPYNKTVREYVEQLIEELALMGFDEVVLSGLACPQANDVQFSQPMSGSPSLTGGVGIFARRMSEKAREEGLRCSVMVYAEELRSGVSAAIAQDPELMFKLFDRVYVQTNSEYLAVDTNALGGYLTAGSGERIVPVLAGEAPALDSWALK